MAAFIASSRSGFIAYFAVVLLYSCYTVSAASLIASNTVKAYDLLPRPSDYEENTKFAGGFKPFYQSNRVVIHYPGSYFYPDDRIKYEATGDLGFHCTEPTRRIRYNLSPLLNIIVHYVWVSRQHENGTMEQLAVKEFFYNEQEEILYIDMVEDMETTFTYFSSVFTTADSFIDGDDRYGIQAFNRTNEETGETSLVIERSTAKDAMKRFVPYFDDSDDPIEHYWIVRVIYGDFPPTVPLMNGRFYCADHYCPPDEPSLWSSTYCFQNMTSSFEDTEFEIVPFSWYQGGDVTPPTNCSQKDISRVDESYLSAPSFGRVW